MELQRLDISDVLLLQPKKIGDQRGFFSETWNAKVFAEFGIGDIFVQDNHSLSVEQGVLRGLHYQSPPNAQSKLVRCVQGSILDVVVDIRSGSPTYGKHVKALISAENWSQIYVPKGFAHGFLTLEPNTEVQYKVSDYYAPESDGAILWNDPAIGIDWGVPPEDVTLSDKDLKAPLLVRAITGF